MSENDPFSSIEPLCRISSSQEELLRLQSLYREPELGQDSGIFDGGSESQLDSESSPVMEPGIIMFSLPESSNLNEDDNSASPPDEFQTPPEESHLVSSEDQRLDVGDAEVDGVVDYGDKEKTAVDLCEHSEFGFSERNSVSRKRIGESTLKRTGNSGENAESDIWDQITTFDLGKDLDLRFPESPSKRVRLGAENGVGGLTAEIAGDSGDHVMTTVDLGRDMELGFSERNLVLEKNGGKNGDSMAVVGGNSDFAAKCLDNVRGEKQIKNNSTEVIYLVVEENLESIEGDKVVQGKDLKEWNEKTEQKLELEEGKKAATVVKEIDAVKKNLESKEGDEVVDVNNLESRNDEMMQKSVVKEGKKTAGSDGEILQEGGVGRESLKKGAMDFEQFGHVKLKLELKEGKKAAVSSSKILREERIERERLKKGTTDFEQFRYARPSSVGNGVGGKKRALPSTFGVAMENARGGDVCREKQALPSTIGVAMENARGGVELGCDKVTCLLDVLKFLSEGSDSSHGETNSIVEMAKEKGLTFFTPRWQRSTSVGGHNDYGDQERDLEN